MVGTNMGGKPIEPTGLKSFDYTKTYPGNVSFAKNATPWRLMKQVDTKPTGYLWDTSATSDFYDPDRQKGCVFGWLIWACNQIKPGVAASEIQQALASQEIPLGTTLYLHLDQHGKFFLDKQAPSGASTSGSGSTSVLELIQSESLYNISGLSVNSRAIGTPGSAGYIPADCGVQDAPFSCNAAWVAGKLDYGAMDSVKTGASSGFLNSLDEVDFANKVNGTILDAPN